MSDGSKLPLFSYDDIREAYRDGWEDGYFASTCEVNSLTENEVIDWSQSNTSIAATSAVAAARKPPEPTQ